MFINIISAKWIFKLLSSIDIMDIDKVINDISNNSLVDSFFN